ncbi:flavin reductase family protein [Variovorax paradoxus]|nr:flavin reductase family protein [Variovorax paradoxus]
MQIDPNDLTSDELYKLMIGSVVPRPICWASTLSRDGIANLAPFSFFTVVSRKPPMVSLTIQPRSDRVQLKDTLINARETGEFVVNIVSLAQADRMHLTSVEYLPEEDEFDITGLGKTPSVDVRPPRVSGAPIAMECKVHSITPMGDVGDNVLVGRVVRFHFRDDMWLPGGRVNTAALQPVGRLAAEYTLADAVFTCPMPADVLAAYASRPWRRIDGRDVGWSPLTEKSWSAAGNVKLAE